MKGNLRTFLCKSLYKYDLRHGSIPFSSCRRQIPIIPSNSFKLDTVLIPKSKVFSRPSGWNLSTQFRNGNESQEFSSESDAGTFDQSKEIDEINLKFAEAREEIEMAMESKETVYFDEEAEAAREAVKKVLVMFESLLGKLAEEERAALLRSMGLKIEQLKAELEQLNE